MFFGAPHKGFPEALFGHMRADSNGVLCINEAGGAVM